MAKNERLLAAKDGKDLAIEMLREMSELSLEKLDEDGELRLANEPKRNVLSRYFDAAVSHFPVVRAGFLAVLTDYVGSAIAGCPASEPVEYYSK